MKFLALLFSFVVLSQPSFSKTKILITGSSTIAPLMLEIGKAFEKSHPLYQVNVQTGGSSRGIADARRGLADIGMVSRKLMNKESDLQNIQIASDGLGVIVHSDNPVSTLNSEQMRKIYLGEIKNWKELGGKDAPITVIHKAEGRSTLEIFLSFFRLKNSQIKPHSIIGDNEQGIKLVSKNPNSIAYVSVGNAEMSQSKGAPIKTVNLNGKKATSRSIAENRYEFVRELNLVSQSFDEEKLKELVQFLKSREVRELISQFNLIPLK